MDKNLAKIDFNPLAYKNKKFLYFKRPKGKPIPVGIPWKCLCGKENPLNAAADQFCAGCGARLRLQENKEDSSNYYTLVITSHLMDR